MYTLNVNFKSQEPNKQIIGKSQKQYNIINFPTKHNLIYTQHIKQLP